MTASAEHYSNLKESLTEIFELHWETGNEVNSKSGSAVVKSTHKTLSSNQTHWNVEIVKVKRGKNKGKVGRRFVYSNKTRPFGDIVTRKDGLIKFNLKNLIQFRTYGAKGITMVATDMPGGQTEIRRNGKIVKTEEVGQVGSGGIDILQKLNLGLNGSSDTTNISNRKIHWFNNKSLDVFEGKHNSAGFIEKGQSNALPKVKNYLTEGFKEGIERREKSMAQVKTVRVA